MKNTYFAFMKHPFVKMMLKAGTTVMLLWFLFAHVDITILKQTVTSIVPFWIVMGVVAGFVLTVLSAWRWLRITIFLKIGLPFRFCVPAYFEAISFNIFIPGSIGGEAVRAIRASRINSRLRESIVSVIFDRALNFEAVIIIAVILLPFMANYEMTVELKLILVGVIVLSVVGTGVILFLPVMSSFRQYRIMREAIRLSIMFRRVFGLPKRLGEVTFLSLAIQIGNISILYLCGLALGISDLAFFQLAIATMLGTLVTALPVSVGGLGLREGAMIWVFMQFGLDKIEAYSLALLYGVMLITQGVPGIFVWLANTMSNNRIVSAK